MSQLPFSYHVAIMSWQVERPRRRGSNNSNHPKRQHRMVNIYVNEIMAEKTYLNLRWTPYITFPRKLKFCQVTWIIVRQRGYMWNERLAAGEGHRRPRVVLGTLQVGLEEIQDISTRLKLGSLTTFPKVLRSFNAEITQEANSVWLKGYHWQFKHHSSKRKARRVSDKPFYQCYRTQN